MTCILATIGTISMVALVSFWCGVIITARLAVWYFEKD